jgi:hypothetical protein
LQNIILLSFYQTPSVQTIFVSINRFNFLTLLLSSYILSMTLYLRRTHVWHVFFHSFHYHLVNWGHLLIVLIMFLTLIKSVTMWPLSDALIAHTFKFQNKLSGDHLVPYFSSSWPTLPIHALAGLSWNTTLINVWPFWAPVKTIPFLWFLYFLELINHSLALPTTSLLNESSLTPLLSITTCHCMNSF